MTRRKSYKTLKAMESAGSQPQLNLTVREKSLTLNSEENADPSPLQPGGKVELEIQRMLSNI